MESFLPFRVKHARRSEVIPECVYGGTRKSAEKFVAPILIGVTAIKIGVCLLVLYGKSEAENIPAHVLRQIKEEIEHG